MSLFGKIFNNTNKSITKSQVKALLPADFPDRMTDYFLDIYKKGKWITPPDPQKVPGKFIVLAKMSNGDGPPQELESTLKKEGATGDIPIFKCDLTSFDLDYDQAHIFSKYVGKVVACAWHYDLQDWRSSILWSDSQYGGTEKIAVCIGIIRI